ncbi:MAG: BlaI/MecI/CopY family transcriptional regulator [Acidobacteriota bacterium]
MTRRAGLDSPESKLPDLAPTELDVLKQLWQSGPSSVREIHDAIGPQRGWAYSTTKTTMDRLVSKGVLQRRSLHGAFVYEALISKPQGIARLVQDFARRVLETDAQEVVPLFTHSGSLSAEEVEELSRLLGTDSGTQSDGEGEQG